MNRSYCKNTAVRYALLSNEESRAACGQRVRAATAIVEGVTDDGEIIQADEFIPNNT